MTESAENPEKEESQEVSQEESAVSPEKRTVIVLEGKIERTVEESAEEDAEMIEIDGI